MWQCSENLLFGTTGERLVKHETFTAEDGTYRFTNLRPGTYVISIGKDVDGKTLGLSA